MTLVKLHGGLGNQMFQYAAGKSLATKNNSELLLDVSAFETYKLREFDLQKLHTDFSIATQKEIDILKPASFFSRIKNKLLPCSFRNYYKESHFHFDPCFYKLKPRVYIQGYFQSYKYFRGAEKQLRQDLKIKQEFISEVGGLAGELLNQESVSVHIRRGDYKNNAAAAYHGILSLDYYNNATALIKTQLTNPKFYIFTDDAQWVKQHFPFNDVTIVSGEFSQTHFEDLYLMSQCKHNIIANSSFSWWAAWLNDNPDKIVIAPGKWFNEGPKDTYDLIPPTWITI